MLPKVSIIILNWNGLNDTLECLDSLFKIQYQNFDVLVVDNGSKRNEADVIGQRFSGKITLIRNEKNLGFTGGNNIAIKKALDDGADYILLLNNDTTVEKDFLGKLVRVAESSKLNGIVGPKINYYGERNKIWFDGGILHWWTGLGLHKRIDKLDNSKSREKVCDSVYITGCAMLVKRSVLEKIGLLDDIYFAYYEDLDFCMRAKKAGFEIKYVPQSKIYHKVSASLGKKSPEYIHQITKNRFVFMKKNFSGIKYFAFLLTFALYKIPVQYFKLSSNEYNAYIEGAKLGMQSRLSS